MSENNLPYTNEVVLEARRLRGLNFTFAEIAETMTAKGYRTRRGAVISTNTLATLFTNTRDLAFAQDPGSVSKEDLINTVLKGPLAPDVKINLVTKITNGEITNLRYIEAEPVEGGGYNFAMGVLHNPAQDVEFELSGPKYKQQAQLIVHFFDKIKEIADQAVSQRHSNLN